MVHLFKICIVLCVQVMNARLAALLLERLPKAIIVAWELNIGYLNEYRDLVR